MPNYLPLLLIGGGIAYMTVAAGKKKGSKYPAIWVSDNCDEIKVFGLPPEKIQDKVDDPKFKAKYKGAIEKWGRETLDLEGWFQDRPGITAEDLDDLALEIASWRYPQCGFGEGMDVASIPFTLYVAIYASIIAYAVKNGIVPLKDIIEVLQEGVISSLGPLMPEGASASMRLPPVLQMVL